MSRKILGFMVALAAAAGLFTVQPALAQGERSIVLAQNAMQLAGSYEGEVKRRFIGGEARTTRIYRLTMNPDLNTGKVLIFENGQLINELGFIVKRTADLKYGGKTQPINARPGYIADNITLAFSRDGKSVRWYHNDGASEGSGTLTR